ncbi:uncharacterized protein [Phyllobates terribilis]|uniref:uncharacterized protein n=1 Tax=Phyllobates terribilis TaxID=111132 RepID=UPI003CCB27EF
MGCMVESPEKNHYCANATKYLAYNTPKSTETSLKTSGTSILKVPGDRISVDLLLLKKKINKILNPGEQSILISLLDYISNLNGSENTKLTKNETTSKLHRDKTQHNLQEQNNSKNVLRPSRFQLLQSKFMNPNHEPPMKKIKEVGKLIFTENQCTNRVCKGSIVRKLDPSKLKLTKDQNGGNDLHFNKGKSPKNKGRVKAILTKFIVAEEKENIIKPESIKTFMPKILNKNTVISALKEKFEQNCTIYSVSCATSSLVPKEHNVKISVSTKSIRNAKVRVLHTSTMTADCRELPILECAALKEEIIPFVQAKILTVEVYSPKTLILNSKKVDSQEQTCRNDKNENNLLCYRQTTIMKENLEKSNHLKKGKEHPWIRENGIESSYESVKKQQENITDTNTANSYSSDTVNVLGNVEIEPAVDVQESDEKERYSGYMDLGNQTFLDSQHNTQTHDTSNGDMKHRSDYEAMKLMSDYFLDHSQKLESSKNLTEHILNECIPNINIKNLGLNTDKAKDCTNFCNTGNVNKVISNIDQGAQKELDVSIYHCNNLVSKSKMQNGCTDEEHKVLNISDNMSTCVKSEETELKNISKMEKEHQVQERKDIGEGHKIFNLNMHEVENSVGVQIKAEPIKVPNCQALKKCSSRYKENNKEETKNGNLCQLYAPEHNLKNIPSVLTERATFSTEPTVPSQKSFATIVKVHKKTLNINEATGSRSTRYNETPIKTCIEQVKYCPNTKPHSDTLLNGKNAFQETGGNKKSLGYINKKQCAHGKVDLNNQTLIGRDLSKIHDHHLRQGNSLEDISLQVTTRDHKKVGKSADSLRTTYEESQSEDSQEFSCHGKANRIDPITSAELMHSSKEGNHETDKRITSKYQIPSAEDLSMSNTINNATINDISKYKVQSYKDTDISSKQLFKPLIVRASDTFKLRP